MRIVHYYPRALVGDGGMTGAVRRLSGALSEAGAEAVIAYDDGPQPPSGEHRYYFKAFALDAVLDLPRGARRQELESAMKGHVIDEAAIMGRYAKH